MSTNPQWKTRRLAARALRVLARTKSLHATLAAYELTLQPAAEAYIKTYDRLRVLSKRRGVEHAEGKAAVADLARSVRAWANQIHALNVIPHFTVGDYIASPNVPDDVISDAQAFMELLNDHTQANPDAIPYLEALREDMVAKLETAQREWGEAEVAGEDMQMLTEQNRAAQQQLSAHLVAFRRNLASVLGTAHPAFQTLRAAKVSRQDAEDGEDINLGGTEPVAVEPQSLSEPEPEPEPETESAPEPEDAPIANAS